MPEDRTIDKITYGIQEDALNVGAVHLESVNAGHLRRFASGESTRLKDNVLQVISDSLDEGGTQGALFDRVQEIAHSRQIAAGEIAAIYTTPDDISFNERLTEITTEYHLEPTEISDLQQARQIDGIPVSGIDIRNTRAKVDAMLGRLEQELQISSEAKRGSEFSRLRG